MNTTVFNKFRYEKRRVVILVTALVCLVWSSAATGNDVVLGYAVGMGGSDSDVGQGIAVDLSGNIYITGIFSGTVDFDPGEGTANLTSAGRDDVFVTKLDSTGKFFWAKSMGGAGSDRGMAVAVDASGNVYTTGQFSETADFDPGSGMFNLSVVGVEDVFVCKFDTGGNFLWARAMGGADSDSGAGIAVDTFGDVYTTGAFNGTADFDPGSGTVNLASAGSQDIFVCKLDSLGNFVWAKAMGGAILDEGYAIAVDALGYVYTTGLFEGTADFDPSVGAANLTAAGGIDVFISKLDSGGSFVWAKSLGGPLTDSASGIAVDEFSNVYTTGFFIGTADFDPGTSVASFTSAGVEDIFVSKLDSEGNFGWARALGGTSSEAGNAIAVDVLGAVYTTGFFGDTVDFDPGTGTANLTSAGDFDVFVQKLNSAGNFTWAKAMSGASTVEGWDIAVDEFGNVHTTGLFDGTADFDPGADTNNLTAAGSFDIFVSKLVVGVPDPVPDPDPDPEPDPGPVAGSSNSGPSSACFIATAAYGTPLAEEVDVLRGVRDEYLLNGVLGTAFVDAYYRLSPPVADVVGGNEGLRGVVRVLLAPVVLFSRVLLGAPGLVLLVGVVLISLTLRVVVMRVGFGGLG